MNVERRQNKMPSKLSFPFAKVLFVLIVLIPTGLAFAYADRSQTKLYQSRTEFAIEDRKQASSPGINGILASIGGSSGEPNVMYTLRRFIQSGDALAQLEGGYGFRKHYTAPNGDWLTRLRNTGSSDNVLKYYKRMIKPRISTTENIVTLEVLAFDPAVAQGISQNLLRISEQFLNKINMQSVEDQVAFQQNELDKNQAILLERRSALTEWRNDNGAFDPMSQVATLQGLISNLELEISTINSEISLLEGADDPARFTPRVRTLNDQRDVLLSQLEILKGRLAGPAANTLSLKISEFERLVSLVEFANRNLEIAMSSLATAQQVAHQQQKYLLLISSSSLPSDQFFPRRQFHTTVVFLASLLIFGVIVLLGTILRDYRRT